MWGREGLVDLAMEVTVQMHCEMNGSDDRTVTAGRSEAASIAVPMVRHAR